MRSKMDDDRASVPGSFDVHIWLKQLRIHHYAKNGLVFIPVLTAHAFTSSALLVSCLAFFAFCLCASGVYVINDMADLEADRQHPTKRERPLAEGRITRLQALIAIPLLLVSALLIAAAVSFRFVLVLAAYLSLTTLYTFWLKRKLFADVVVLALLYSLRVVGGAVAIEVELSEWLLVFSLLVFTSLALIKRYTDLSKRIEANSLEPADRGYRNADLAIVGAMATAAGFNAVTVFALYVSSDTVQQLYSRPRILWLICPVLMYWIGRALILAHRGAIDDDPIVFALKDPVSFLALGAIVTLVLAAI